MRLFWLAALAAGLLVAESASAAEACTPLPGAQAAWARPDARYILVGETHGIAETQQAFVDLVCAAAASGRPVVVALEQNAEGQAGLDAFLASDGGPAAVAAVMEALAWYGPMRDGRSSVAALDMLQRLRELRQAGQIVGVTAFLDWSDKTQAGHERQMAKGMAAAAAAHPDALVIGLMGSIHAMKAARPGRDGVTYRLAADLLPPDQVVSLYFVHSGGGAWFCSQDVCMARPLRSPPDERARGVHISPGEIEGYDGVLSIGGPVTASPPAESPGRS